MDALPKFDGRRRANQYLADLGMTQVTFSKLVPASASKINLCLKYKQAFTQPDEKEIISVLLRCLELQSAFSPLELNWDSPEFVQMLLQRTEGIACDEIRSWVTNLFSKQS